MEDSTLCVVSGCNERRSAKYKLMLGMCKTHFREHQEEHGPRCADTGCGRAARTKGMCRAHYSQMQREAGPKCAVEGCSKYREAQGLCGKHHYRLRTYGSTDSNVLKNHHGMNAGDCAHDGCGKSAAALGYCSTHYRRFKLYGSTEDSALVRQVNINSGNCSVDGCDNPMRKRTWCAGHYSQWTKTGEVQPFKFKWAERGSCIVCGAPCEQRGRRTYCSSRCQVLVSRTGGVPAATKPCSRCGEAIELFEIGAAGRKKRSDSSMCKPCRHARRTTRHHMSIKRLVQRDGAWCSICGEEVDVTLKKPDSFSPSVDHVLPYSLGGTHDPENLALAHLWCNQVKNNRVGWSLKTA